MSYRLTAEVDCTGLDVAAGEADGVIVTCGDRFCGYTFFIKNGFFVHDYNAAGEHFVVRSPTQVPADFATLSYEFDRSSRLFGVGTIAIAGHEPASLQLGPTIGVHISPSGLCVGYSAFAAVSPDYEAPFAFPGHIERVIIDLGTDRGTAQPTTDALVQ